jgi:hypothetical protein
MQQVLGLILGILLLGVGVAAAQQSLEQCKHTDPSPAAGNPGEDITVGVAATTVISPSTSLCGGLVVNTDQVSSIRCRQTGTDPDGTTGLLVLPYMVLTLGQDAQLGLRCIRSSTATGDVAVSVYLYTP